MKLKRNQDRTFKNKQQVTFKNTLVFTKNANQMKDFIVLLKTTEKKVTGFKKC